MWWQCQMCKQRFTGEMAWALAEAWWSRVCTNAEEDEERCDAACNLAFQKVKKKKRIIWKDYAEALDAALQCVDSEQSRDFAIENIPKVVPFFTGRGDSPRGSDVAGSAWDDWCGKDENRRKGQHPLPTLLRRRRPDFLTDEPTGNVDRSPAGDLSCEMRSPC